MHACISSYRSLSFTCNLRPFSLPNLFLFYFFIYSHLTYSFMLSYPLLLLHFVMSIEGVFAAQSTREPCSMTEISPARSV
ncbi:hypothetical protein BDV12DRAFT_32933 [Aspergillus spectabilis]